MGLTAHRARPCDASPLPSRGLTASLAALILALGALSASAQTTTRVSGTFRADRMPGDSDVIEFTCQGEPVCTGTFRGETRIPNCSAPIIENDRFTIEGLDLSRPGVSTVTMKLEGGDFQIIQLGGGACRIGTRSLAITPPVRLEFDGRNGTLQFSDPGTGAVYTGTFTADRTAAPPVFPMDVQATFDTTARVTATFQPRPQDVGAQASVYVFAIAPVTSVRSEAAKAARYGHIAGRDTDTPVQCVLAQLTPSGQLTGVSASNMQAYVTGVLSGQAQAVTMLDGVPVANVAGATFYLGYGSSATAMLESGVNRSAATAPGTAVCKPEPPETGWWWNPAEGGRGYSVEVRGNKIFFAAFHYDVSGRSTWHVATGDGVSLDGSLYSNKPLYAASGGQTLGGAYRGAPTVAEIGRITLAFANKRSGTMIWPGGVVPIERFNIVANGIDAAPRANQPETGWWWNPDESGRGFFLEWQNGTIDLAGYMYDEQGNSIWYLGVYETPDIRAMSGNWWSYANGQAMGGTYKPATRVSDNVAPVSITFSGPDTALMTLPNGRSTALRRHRF